jgi:hypothetical protein
VTIRPADWQKIINAEAETCYWLAPDGSRHPATDDENADVRRELTQHANDQRQAPTAADCGTIGASAVVRNT